MNCETEKYVRVGQTLETSFLLKMNTMYEVMLSTDVSGGGGEWTAVLRIVAMHGDWSERKRSGSITVEVVILDAEGEVPRGWASKLRGASPLLPRHMTVARFRSARELTESEVLLYAL